MTIYCLSFPIVSAVGVPYSIRFMVTQCHSDKMHLLKQRGTKLMYVILVESCSKHHTVFAVTCITTVNTEIFLLCQGTGHDMRFCRTVSQESVDYIHLNVKSSFQVKFSEEITQLQLHSIKAQCNQQVNKSTSLSLVVKPYPYNAGT